MAAGWLERNQGKSHWTLGDIFKSPSRRVVAFTHRNYRIGLHTHEFTELNIVAGGHGRHYMEGKAMEVSAGDAFAIPPMVEHGYVDDGGLDVCHVLAHPQFAASNLERLRWLEGYLMFFTVEPYFRRQGQFRHGLRLSGESFEEALRLCRRMEEEGAKALSGFEWAQECLLSELAILLCRSYAAASVERLEEPGAHPQMRAVMAAMEFARKRRAIGVGLDAMAKAAGLERSHFCRVFRKATGMTPMDFARYELAKEAQRLLLEGSLSVGEVAAKLGYCDAAHFSRSFRAATGRNPSELRKSSKRRQHGHA